LLGNLDYENKRYFENLAQEFCLKPQQINFLNPVAEKEIIQIASNHHIGIASEVPYVLNRELCLTNKIYIYLLAGNAILFSNTHSQEKFAIDNPEIGLVYKYGDIDNCADIIKRFFENPEWVKTYRLNSLKLSRVLNWERESEKLIAYLSIL